MISKKEAATVVDLFFDRISAALAEGERVEVRRFCTFYIKEYESYNGRNPKTGEAITVAPKKLPFFKCGQVMKRYDQSLVSYSKIDFDTLFFDDDLWLLPSYAFYSRWYPLVKESIKTFGHPFSVNMLWQKSNVG